MVCIKKITVSQCDGAKGRRQCIFKTPKVCLFPKAREFVGEVVPLFKVEVGACQIYELNRWSCVAVMSYLILGFSPVFLCLFSKVDGSFIGKKDFWRLVYFPPIKGIMSGNFLQSDPCKRFIAGCWIPYVCNQRKQLFWRTFEWVKLQRLLFSSCKSAVCPSWKFLNQGLRLKGSFLNRKGMWVERRRRETSEFGCSRPSALWSQFQLF